MFGVDLFHSLLPLENLIGFGASDFIEIIVAALLVTLALASRPWIEPIARRLATKTGWCMLFLALLPVAFRLALLPGHPVPAPNGYDAFAHLLAADTLLHFRLANPPHPLHQFFETLLVLQTPAYASIYPIGQGVLLALGRAAFGLPWAGVLLSSAALCGLCYWMLLAWTTPEWALLGGILAVFEFGPLSAWMNNYSGGSLSAAAGCLVFGALPRLRETGRWRYGALLGLGLAIHWLTRPYETIILILAALLFLSPVFPRTAEWSKLAKPVLAATAVLLAAIGLSLLQNKQIAGNWTTSPSMLSRSQYGVPAAFTWQANSIPRGDLTREQQFFYQAQSSFLQNRAETIKSYLLRLEYRVRFYRFFFLPPLYVALPFFFLGVREPRFLWVAITLLLFALGVNFDPIFDIQSLAAVTCLFVLMAVTGLEKLADWKIRDHASGGEAARLILYLCVAHFVFWYGVHLFDTSDAAKAVGRYESWDAINHGKPTGRAAVDQQLVTFPGKQLVLVRYWPQHIFEQEWVYNAADIDRSRVVWARDLGPAENEKLLRYYPDRTAWLLEPDAIPPRLTHYVVENPKPVPEETKPAPVQTQTPPPLRLEQVR